MRRWTHVRGILRLAATLAVGPLVAAAGGAPEALPFFLYADLGAAANRGAWSNVMAADGSSVALEPADGRVRAEGGTALRLDFRFGPAPGAWAGIAVASAPGYWGATPGPGFDLSAARRLVLDVRGERGGEGIRVKVAPAGDAAFGDAAPLPFDSGWLRLSAGWQTVTVPVDGRALTRVVIPLMIIANRAHNPSGAATVLLDAVRFER
jgi:hypothetical protein